MRCPSYHRAFQDLIVVRVGGNHLHVASDGNETKNGEQIGHGIEGLLCAECKLRLQLLRQLVQQFAAGYAFDGAGTSQFKALERLFLPAAGREQDVRVEDGYFPHGRSSCTRSSTNVARSSSDMLFQS